MDFRLNAGLGEVRRLPGWGRKVAVAPAAAAAVQNRARFARCVHIRNHRAGFRLADDRPDRYFDDEIFTALARAVACRAVHAVFRRVVALEAEVQQRVHVQISVKADIAAVTAVSAVRPAVQDEFFPVERHAAVAAVACLAGDFYMVYEIAHSSSKFRIPIDIAQRV